VAIQTEHSQISYGVVRLVSIDVMDLDMLSLFMANTTGMPVHEHELVGDVLRDSGP
jgi:hypothetical protein